MLRSKSLKKVKPKQIKGRSINGPMLIQLAKSYIEALNEGKVPTIDLAWDNVQAVELQRTLEEAVKEHSDLLDEAFKDMPISEEKMKESFEHARNHAIQTFKQGVMSGSDILNTPKGEQFL